MPASPTDSTSSSDRAPDRDARTVVVPVDDPGSPAAVKGAVSPASPTGSKPGTLKCPQCGGSLDRYEGDNPHKAGTGWCPAEGVRVPLAAQSSASTTTASAG